MVDRIDPRPGESLLDPACGTGGFLTCAIRHMREVYVKRVPDSGSAVPWPQWRLDTGGSRPLS
jgi:type I restriction enzyme M protein